MKHHTLYDGSINVYLNAILQAEIKIMIMDSPWTDVRHASTAITASMYGVVATIAIVAGLGWRETCKRII